MTATSPKLAVETNPWGAFSAQQGKSYAQNRRSYSPKLYDSIVDFHKATGGQLKSLLDVGCGPGVAVRDLGPLFTTAVGIDPSRGMVDTARSLGGSCAGPAPIRFEVSSAEELGCNLASRIPDGSVDLIVAANSAHYFCMERFWAAAARVLRPGGSVALWASTPVGMHPSVPNAAAIEARLETIRAEEMARFEKFGPSKGSDAEAKISSNKNTLSTGDIYRNLLLPWHEAVQDVACAFDRANLYQRLWTGREGRGSHDADDFFSSQPRVDLDTMEQIMGITAGPYLDWRNAHPDLAGTEQDMLRRSRREIERLQREVGVEEGKEWVKSSVEGFLLIIKRV